MKHRRLVKQGLLLILLLIVLLKLVSFEVNMFVTADVEEQPSASLVTPAQPTRHLPWSLFWKLFRQRCVWQLQYRIESTWINRTDLLSIERYQPYENTTKITLVFNTLSFVADYRLTLGISQKVMHYANISNHRIELTYRDYVVIFDWSDLLSVSNLIFKRGFKNDLFWFRIRKDNVPADKTYELDPTVIVTQSSSKAVDYPSQLKTFRNPRGTEWNYAMVYNQSGSDYQLTMFKSSDGDNWVFDTYIHNFTADTYCSSSLWTHENDSLSALVVYVVFSEVGASPSLYYVRGEIADAGSTVSFDVEQVLDTDYEQRFPFITIAEDGYIHIAFQEIVGGDYIRYVLDFSADVQEWNVVGVSPYLNGSDDGNYIWESSKNNQMEYFSFYWGMLGTPTSADAYFYCRQEAGGNDYFTVEWYYAFGWHYSGDVTPTAHASDYSWQSIDVLNELATETRINNAQLRLDKKSNGGGDDVFIDACYLDITTNVDRSIKAYISTVVYEPSSSDWSKRTIEDDNQESYKIPIVVPLHEVSDVAYMWRCEDTATGKEYIRVKECNWTAPASFALSAEVGVLTECSGGHLVEAFWHFSSVVDENNLIHTVASWYASGLDYYRYYNYTVGGSSGGSFGTYQAVWGSTACIYGASLSIDLSVTPNKIYAFVISMTDTNAIRYKTQYVDGVDWSVGGWAANQGVGIYGLSTSYQTGSENVVQVIFKNRYSGHAVYFEEIRSAFVTYQFFEAGTLYVNGTSKPNGTVMEYKHHSSEFVSNITFVSPYSYAFRNYTYDSSTSFDNPFYLSVIQDCTVNAYCYFIYDCLYIGLNSTLAGTVIEFKGDWDDLRVAEGLSHWLYTTNKTGSWVNGSWSDTWTDTSWAVATDLMIETVGTVVAGRFIANSTSGVEYNSTILFFTTSEQGAASGGFSAPWLMYGITVGLIFGFVLYEIARRANGSVSRR